jgi:hypothetical protein
MIFYRVVKVGAGSPAGLPESVRKYLEYHTAEWSSAREFLVRKVLEMLDYSRCVKSQELTDRLDVRRHYSRMMEEGILALVLRGGGRERCVTVVEDLERHFKGYLPKALEDFLERFKEENRAKVREVLERIAKGEKLSWDEFKYGDSAVKYALTKARESGLLWYVEVGGRKGSGFFMINPFLYKE